jgi:cobalt/nickel transport system permease protein
MAVVGVAVAYMAYRTILRLTGGAKAGIFTAGFVAAWLSVEVTALAVALQLAVSGTSPANIALPAMAGVHALIGLGEGLITLGALSFIQASRRDLLRLDQQPPVGSRLVWVTGLLVAIALAVASPLASSHPDGLEWVARQQGFLGNARGPAYTIIPDYILPGIASPVVATILAGVIGTLIVFGVALGVAYARRKRQL